MLDINLLQLRIKELEQMEYGLSMALDIEKERADDLEKYCTCDEPCDY